DGENDRRRRKNEARTSDEQSAPPSNTVSNVNRKLGRIGSRNEIGGAEVVEKLFVREPATPAHDLLLHERDVRRGSAERRGTEPEEENSDLNERGTREAGSGKRGP